MAREEKIGKSELQFVGLVMIITFVFTFVIFFEQDLIIPVQGANSNDWNPNSFWYEPWGRSGVHKGIDIFARRGTTVLSSVSGLVVYCGTLELGGNVVTILGPKWWVHYYAHLDSIKVHIGQWVSQGEKIGSVGNTGNAQGKQPHLHYSILSLIPNPNGYLSGTQGWKRIFYLDPTQYLIR